MLEMIRQQHKMKVEKKKAIHTQWALLMQPNSAPLPQTLLLPSICCKTAKGHKSIVYIYWGHTG